MGRLRQALVAFSLDERGDGRDYALWGLLVLAAGLLYYLSFYGPLWLDNYEVGRKCEEALNSSWQLKDAEETRAIFLNLIHNMGTEIIDVDGAEEKIPIIDPVPDDLYVEFDQSVTPPVLSIDVTYTRYTYLPFTDKEKVYTFSASCSKEAVAESW